MNFKLENLYANGPKWQNWNENKNKNKRLNSYLKLS